jgi:hypothetical protein
MRRLSPARLGLAAGVLAVAAVGGTLAVHQLTHRPTVVLSLNSSPGHPGPNFPPSITLDPGSYHVESTATDCPPQQTFLTNLPKDAAQFTLLTTDVPHFVGDFTVDQRQTFKVTGIATLDQPGSSPARCTIHMTLTRS